MNYLSIFTSAYFRVFFEMGKIQFKELNKENIVKKNVFGVKNTVHTVFFDIEFNCNFISGD